MSDTSGTGPVILIVEDDKIITRALEAGLTDKGYQPVAATTGEDGLRVALESHPQLILLDYTLPDINGVTVLERLRKDEWGASVPVVIASNVYDVDIINAIMALGVQDYVLKIDVTIDQIIALAGKYVPAPAGTGAAAAE